MKRTNAFIALMAAAVLLTGCGITRRTPEQEAHTAVLVREALDSRSFELDIDYMIPLRGRAKSVSQYSVKVKDNKLDSHLPYFGVAQNVPYGGGEGLTFEEEILAYRDSGLVGQCRTITVTVRNREDTYDYVFEIYDNGSARLHVHCRNRDDISFSGTLELEED